VTALELADMVMRGEVKLSPQQMRVMIELLPFHAPKLSAVGIGYLTNNTFAERLDRAIDRSDRARLTEGKAIDVEDQWLARVAGLGSITKQSAHLFHLFY